VNEIENFMLQMWHSYMLASLKDRACLISCSE